MLKLSEADFLEISAMKKFGLLVHMSEQKLMDIVEPTGMILCSDGHQKKDIDDHVSGICQRVNAEKNIHELKLAGYQLMAASSRIISPMFKQNLQIMDELNKGIKLGKISKRVIIYGHYPCGLAAVENLTLHDCLELKIRGRSAILQTFNDRGLNVSVAMQVDFRTCNGEANLKGQKTYHIETSAWEEYKSQRGYAPSPNLFSRAANNR